MKVQRVLTAKAKEAMWNLIKNMKVQNKYSTNPAGTSFNSEILSALETDKVSFFEGSFNLSTKPIVTEGKSKISMNKGKVKLVVDNLSGNILSCTKPFLMSWNSLMKKVTNDLTVLDCLKDIEGLVKKKTIKMSGFTQEGFVQLQDALKNSK